MIFQVITKIPPIEQGGNLAIPHVPLIEEVEHPSAENDYNGRYRPVELGIAMLALRQPVFRLGEIVICEFGGREIICDQRKPSKWDVEYEEFERIEDAVRRSQEVTA